MKDSVQSQLSAMKARMRLPVIAAPMFLVSGPKLVIEACRAGVMGAFPAPNARNIDDLRDWLDEVSGVLSGDHAPFALNMITHTSYHRFEAELELVQEYKPGLVITALGGPHRVTDAVHGYGGLVFADVNSPRYARKAIEKGADGLVLVCAGAGGHTGEYAMLPFIEEVRGFYDGPLVVGGGISSGRAVRAVEQLGVDFAYLGTRFLSTAESMIGDAYREMVWQSQMEDLIASRAVTGALGNWMRASVEAAGLTEEDMRAEAKLDFSSDMMSDNKAWKTIWSAGQGVGSIKGRETVAEAVASLMQGYAEALVSETGTSPFADRARHG